MAKPDAFNIWTQYVYHNELKVQVFTKYAADTAKFILHENGTKTVISNLHQYFYCCQTFSYIILSSKFVPDSAINT